MNLYLSFNYQLHNTIELIIYKLITDAKMNTLQLYTTDFHAWTQEQVNLLKTQQWGTLDTLNLIEELETLGRKERQELRNRLVVCQIYFDG